MISRWLGLGLIFLNVLALVGGQVLWKLGVSRHPLGAASPVALERWSALMTSPFIWGGLALYAVATVIWLHVLSQMDLSYAYPLQSLAYVLGMAAGILLFGETVSPTAWVGVALILAGVSLLALS